MRPEEALELARRAANSERAAGAYTRPARELVVVRPERVDSDQLMEWAMIEPDMALVASTRRFGGPITLFKRWRIHVLRQYLKQIESQQTRFNVHLLARVVEQEERLAMYEGWLRDELRAGAGAPSQRQESSGEPSAP